MQAQQVEIAKANLQASHEGTLSFPEICRNLISAGFEGYMVDYRGGTTTYYLPEGECVTLQAQVNSTSVAESFDNAAVAAQIRWAQSQAEDYSYDAFSRNVKRAGCAGYLVSFLGRRVVYLGRTGEMHVELFPSTS